MQFLRAEQERFSAPCPGPLKRERERDRSQSLESELDESTLTGLDLAAAHTLRGLGVPGTKAKRPRAAQGPRSDDGEETTSSSSSTGTKLTAAALRNAAAAASCGTRSYTWRGPRKLGPNGSVCPGQVLSSDPEEDDETGAGAPGSSGREAGGDKEWAALTTWLRMNLHHPRTAKREVLFLGRHIDGRGWQFYLNPALSWADVSPETKMRLRTLPQETELAFIHKYPGKPDRDWVKKCQKYRPPGSSVTYSVPLADMIYSMTAIYYQHEGRPGTGQGRAAAAAAAAAATPAAAAGGAASSE